MKIIMFFVMQFRRLRSRVATLVLHKRCKSYGTCVSAARIPRIGSEVVLEVGQHVGFNGFTATGWGWVKIGNYFHSGTNVMICTPKVGHRLKVNEKE